MLDLTSVLYIDTESDIKTHRPESIQLRYRGKNTIITEFNPFYEDLIRSYWNEASAVIFFNAPYDMGVLSILFSNSYSWVEGDDVKTGFWKMNLFGNIYKVRRIGGHRNLIKAYNREQTAKEKKRKQKGVKSTPVLDMLKLWTILIESDDLTDSKGVPLRKGLKDILERHNYPKGVIPYSPENARTDAYRCQDVEGLEWITHLFFEKVENILDLNTLQFSDWADIKSPATFTKRAYAMRYPLKDWKKINDANISKHEGLARALEQAYKGGITLSMHRGKIENTGWVDIKSAYANTIKHFNTDRFLVFDVVKHEGSHWDYKKSNCLLQVRHNFCIESIDKSLKMFKLEEPAVRYVWYDDILASMNFYKDYRYEVLGGYEFIPLNENCVSLVEEWVKAKEEPGLKKKNFTLYQYYKFLSNTSYGIKAQRTPFTTIHTNMVIAGMITANVHRILSIINKTIEDFGCTPKYNDTDSCCFAQNRCFEKQDMENLISEINRRITPYVVEGEGYNKTTTFLSLKRYLSEGGEGKDKVRLHGKGRYNVYSEDMKNYIKEKKLPDKELCVTQLAGNTLRTLNQIVKLYPYLEEYKAPFCFVKNVQTDRSMEDFFNSWYCHIDTKTTLPDGDISADTEFSREFIKFNDIMDAYIYFKAFYEETPADDFNAEYRAWDAELEEDFDLEG